MLLTRSVERRVNVFVKFILEWYTLIIQSMTTHAMDILKYKSKPHIQLVDPITQRAEEHETPTSPMLCL